MRRYTVRLCYRNQDTHTLLMVQDFYEKDGTPKRFRSVKAGIKFLESKVTGMRSVKLEPRIDIYGQVMDGEKVEHGIALF